MDLIVTKIEINASREKVFKVLMDFESYPKWNPVILKMSGSARVGSKLNMTLKLINHAASEINPKVLKVEMDREIRFFAGILDGVVFKGEHYFSLEDTRTGCLLTHGEEFSGILTPLMMWWFKKDIIASYKQHNEQLKQYVENRSEN